jgi:hypothetical protein
VAAKKAAETAGPIVIKDLQFKTLTTTIRGTAPYVQLRFSQKQKNKLKDIHSTPETDKTKKKVREPKDYDALYEEAMYQTEDGHRGINLMSFKRSMIAACRGTSMSMKMGKMAFFIKPDGFDEFEEIPLVYFSKGEPHSCEHVCRNANGMPDLRIRAMWDTGWEVILNIEYDAEMIDSKSVINLLTRAGRQIGIGEGRPDSTKSDGAGMGWGIFEVLEAKEL